MPPFDLAQGTLSEAERAVNGIAVGTFGDAWGDRDHHPAEV